MTDINPQDAITSYHAAYVAARGGTPPIITYRDGWYTFEGQGIRYRSLTTLRNRLLKAAKASIP